MLFGKRECCIMLRIYYRVQNNRTMCRLLLTLLTLKGSIPVFLQPTRTLAFRRGRMGSMTNRQRSIAAASFEVSIKLTRFSTPVTELQKQTMCDATQCKAGGHFPANPKPCRMQPKLQWKDIHDTKQYTAGERNARSIELEQL